MALVAVSGDENSASVEMTASKNSLDLGTQLNAPRWNRWATRAALNRLRAKAKAAKKTAKDEKKKAGDAKKNVVVAKKKAADAKTKAVDAKKKAVDAKKAVKVATPKKKC